MLTANETIAMLKAWPTTSLNRDDTGGSDGGGKLDTANTQTCQK